MNSRVNITVSKIDNDSARCGYCHESLFVEEPWTCKLCGGLQHVECYDDTQTCLSLGCKNKGPSERPQAPVVEVALAEGRVESFFQIVERLLMGALCAFLGLGLTLFTLSLAAELAFTRLLSYDIQGFYWGLAIMAGLAFLGGLSKSFLLRSWRSFGQALRFYRQRSALLTGTGPTSTQGAPTRPSESGRVQIRIESHSQETNAGFLNNRTLNYIRPLQFTYLSLRFLVGLVFSALLTILALYFLGSSIFETISSEHEENSFKFLLVGVLASAISVLLSWVTYHEALKAHRRSKSIFANWRRARNNTGPDSAPNNEEETELTSNSESQVDGDNH
ncbi:MAG: hypothetical protein P1V97_09215 [Planctomycetota bacterium]|nr:hypothetical protein [Planctomycetota bacterium]